jgi:hypothetical protein
MSEKSLLPDLPTYEKICHYQVGRPRGAIFFPRMYLFQISGNLRPERQYQADGAIFENIRQNKVISVQKRKLLHLPSLRKVKEA